MAAARRDGERRERPHGGTGEPASRRTCLERANVWGAIVVGLVATSCISGASAQPAGRIVLQQPANGVVLSAFLGRPTRFSFLSSIANDATLSWGLQTVLDERLGLPPSATFSCGGAQLSGVVGCQGGNLTVTYQPRADQVEKSYTVCANITSTRNGVPVLAANTTNST
jgi:hypothetical protein